MLVLAYNEATDTVDLYPVTQVHEHLDPVIILLTIDDDLTDDHPGLVIETTPEHPFYVAGTWVNAEDLTVGTVLSSFDGEQGILPRGTITSTVRVEQEQMMYDLTVDTAHTFFVSEGQYLVHNSGPCPWTSPAGLVYDVGSTQGNRVAHVFEHLAPNPLKPNHTVFNVGNSSDILPLLDEAYTRILTNGINPVTGDPGAFVVPMGRVIGTQGETSIRLVLKPGTTEVITAYPWR